jgi:short subunit dehydrogenase-like uncharacterized protein
VTGRVVVFGATGFTGSMVAQTLVDRGLRPVVAGRSADAVRDVAERLGGLDHALADATDPSSVAALVGPGDVLVSTVGPFVRYGGAAVEAAVMAGAHYVDTTGEPAFVRGVFEEWAAPARAVGSVLLPAFGYDYLPGNLAAAVAVARAAGSARSVDIGYFTSGPMDPRALSSGTVGSLLGSAFRPGYDRSGGRLVDARMAGAARSFVVGGRRRAGVSVSGSEQLAVPQAFPEVGDVRVFLGWFGPFSYPLTAAARLGGPVLDLLGWSEPLSETLLTRLGATGRGPDPARRARNGTLVVAETKDAAGRLLTRAEVSGPNPYDLTAGAVAWAAAELASGKIEATGALGPVAAFGLDRLRDGCAELGLTATEQVAVAR